MLAHNSGWFTQASGNQLLQNTTNQFKFSFSPPKDISAVSATPYKKPMPGPVTTMHSTARKGVKRKLDGNLTRIKLFPAEVEKRKKLMKKKTAKSKNKNNSKSRKKRRLSYSIDTSSLAGQSDNSGPLGARTDPQRRYLYYNNPFAPPPMVPNFPIGNPPIMQSEPMAFGNAPGNYGFPAPCPARDMPHQNHIQHLMGSQGRPNPGIECTTLCNETPQIMGCGRWYRLQRQEEAKREGFIPLLQVMFCCCCNELGLLE